MYQLMLQAHVFHPYALYDKTVMTAARLPRLGSARLCMKQVPQQASASARQLLQVLLVSIVREVCNL